MQFDVASMSAKDQAFYRLQLGRLQMIRQGYKANSMEYRLIARDPGLPDDPVAAIEAFIRQQLPGASND